VKSHFSVYSVYACGYSLRNYSNF